MQRRIFDMFEQVNMGTVREYGGSGLGLSICRELALLMQGDIDVVSQPGKGALFRVRVGVATAGSGRAEPVPQLPPRRVAIIDPSPVTGAIVLTYLRHWGLDVTLHSPLSGVNLAADIELAVVVVHATDSATGHAQAIEQIAARALPSIQITAHNRLYSGTPGRSLPLPFRRDQLLASLRHYLLAPIEPLPGAVEAESLPIHFNACVLIAEDNPVNQEVLRRMLDSLGCYSTIVEDGLAAVALASAGWDIILMDVEMPGLNGVEATQRIRADALASGAVRTPIVAVTANAFADERQRYLASGMDACLVKPFTRMQLLEVLERHLPAAGAPPLRDVGSV
jgi:CheY-like chemotaxis protein